MQCYKKFTSIFLMGVLFNFVAGKNSLENIICLASEVLWELIIKIISQQKVTTSIKTMRCFRSSLECDANSRTSEKKNILLNPSVPLLKNFQFNWKQIMVFHLKKHRNYASSQRNHSAVPTMVEKTNPKNLVFFGFHDLNHFVDVKCYV